MHITKNGKQIKISDMSDGHLRNTIALNSRRAVAGVKIQSGGGDGDGVWYDVDVLYGDDALDALNQSAYVAEQRQRQN